MASPPAQAQERAAAVLARLEGRHRQRAEALEAARASSASLRAPEEDAAAFLAAFAEARSAAAAGLQARADACGPEGSPDAQAALADEVAGALATCDRLRAMAAGASYYLTSFDVRACEGQSNALRDLAHAVRAKHLPRRRFRFGALAQHSRAGFDGALAHALGACGVPPAAQPAAAAAAAPADIGARDAVLEDFADGTYEVDVAGVDATIRNGRRAVVVCRGRASALRLARLRDCVVLCVGDVGSVDGPAYVEEGAGGAVAVEARQLRIHDTRGVSFYADIDSKPIMEDSTDLAFAPFRAGAGDVDVADFNRMLRGDSAARNWRAIPPEERKFRGATTEAALLADARACL